MGSAFHEMFSLPMLTSHERTAAQNQNESEALDSLSPCSLQAKRRLSNAYTAGSC